MFLLFKIFYLEIFCSVDENRKTFNEADAFYVG
jgi:hypothetical protein